MEYDNEGERAPRIIAFLCNWCSYAGADLAGTSRIQYPSNVRVVRVPCSGRINPLYIIKALVDGVDGVMISGCHPGDCHYLSGNMHARRRFIVLRKLLSTVGIDQDRVHFTWASASEGERFAEAVRKATEKVEKAEAVRKATEKVKKAEAVGKATEKVKKAEAVGKATEKVEKTEAVGKATEKVIKEKADREANDNGL